MSQAIVKDHMSQHPLTIHANSSVDEAEAIMKQNGIRHLPVFDDDNPLVGILSNRDTANAGAVSYALGLTDGKDNKVKVKDVMTNFVEFVLPNTPMVDAARMMVQSKIGALPVVEDAASKKVLGVVTEVDALAHYISQND